MTTSPLRPRLEAAVLRATGASTLRRLCPACGSTGHGRPALVGGLSTYVSLSYADGLGLAAWTRDGPIGVDVEAAGSPVGTYGDRREWTRAEAILKAAGEGLRSDPRDGFANAWTTALPLGSSWLATVAVLGTDPAEVDWLTVHR